MESTAFAQLPFLAVATATAFLFSPVRHEAWRLLRRTRWLMLVLLLTYAYTVPGIVLWPALSWLSPSLEGLQTGGVRVGRLVLLLIGLAILLAYTSRPRLIYGLYCLTKPLTWFGFDRGAFAVRLGLTLDYVEHAPKPAHWLDALRTLPTEESGPTRYTLQRERWQAWDSTVILAGLLLIGIVLA